MTTTHATKNISIQVVDKGKKNPKSLQNIKCEKILLQVPKKTLLVDTDLVIVGGFKYALIGSNGIGKSTLLKAIHNKNWDIPKHIDIFYVDQEVKADPHISVFDMVIDVNAERQVIMKEYNNLKIIVEETDLATDAECKKYEELFQELQHIGAFRDESTVRQILHGMGFDPTDQDRATSEFSGGWRMRMSIAKALYMKPKLLLLDEPTNHLDINATIWLTSYLSNTWKNTLIVVSHNKNFIDQVCNNIIRLHCQKLCYYKGNYSDYEMITKKNQIHLDKEWVKVEKTVKGMKKKNTTKKEVQAYLDKNKQYKPDKPYKVRILFEEVGKLKSPVITLENFTFGYNPNNILFQNINKIINMETRIALVGKNGVGKTTLIKNIVENIQLSGMEKQGEVRMNRAVRIGYFTQHSTEVLPSELTPAEYLLSMGGFNGIQDVRRYLGRIGLEGNLHNSPMQNFSGGQKARVVFASLCVKKPHVLLLDEPTNNLDMESRDALIAGINEYEGGVIMITHDIQLIQNTNTTLWELKDQQIYDTCYEDYETKVLGEMK
jgi:ATPase subunit of ABC transporter with duplicated ATPase domains